MFTRRIGMAALGAVMILAAGAMPAAAAGPTRPGQVAAERPLTADEKAASDRKIAAAMRYLASPQARAAIRTTLACATPNGTPEADADAASDGLDDLDRIGDPATNATCNVPNDFLPVSARDQIRGHYCGPAVGQVIANYTWAVPLNANKYTQQQIAGWMRTDELGMTTSPTMVRGLEFATAGAPRRPANWAWVITELRDTDRDHTFGDQLHDYVRANVSGSRMPLAISVKPHDANGRFHLSSWVRPVNSVGHWIAAYGWRGFYDGTNSSKILYTDSSRDEGGGTGLFSDPMRHMGGMIRDHTQVFVW
jgi:hypothetical protein